MGCDLIWHLIKGVLGVFPGDALLVGDDVADFGDEVGRGWIGDVGEVAADVVGVGGTEECGGDAGILH